MHLARASRSKRQLTLFYMLSSVTFALRRTGILSGARLGLPWYLLSSLANSLHDAPHLQM
jgi:hypothetical protein